MSPRSKRIERRLKRLVFGTLARRERHSVENCTIDLSTIKKVLFVRANFRMGDLLLITPAVAATRATLPTAHLDLAGPPCAPALLAHHPNVDRIFIFGRCTLFRPWALARLIHALRRERYDAVVDCARGGSFLGASLCAVSGGRFRVAAAESQYRAFFNVHVPHRRWSRHKIDEVLALLAGIGIAPVTRDMHVTLTGAECERAATRWKEYGLPCGRVVGIIVGGRGTKRLPMSHLFHAVLHLRKRGIGSALLVGPEESGMVPLLRGAMPQGTVVLPPLALREFAAILARFTLIVTADTGPMHLAVALGVPTIAVLQTAASLSYRPLGSRHRVVYQKGGVSSDNIVQAIEELLGASSDRPGADSPT